MINCLKMSDLRLPLEYAGARQVSECIGITEHSFIVKTSWLGGDRKRIAYWLYSNLPAFSKTSGNTVEYVVDEWGHKWCYCFDWKEVLVK